MAFQNNKLSVMAYANGFTLWHYKDTKLKRSEIDDNFFSRIYTLCGVGDKIMLNLQDGYYEVIIVEISGTPNKMQVKLKEIVHLEYTNEADDD